MAAGKVHVEGMLLFEQPFVKVPYENYRKVFRTSQRAIEKDFNIIHSLSQQAAERGEYDTVESVDAMIARVEGLKRKLLQLQDTAGSSTKSIMRERMQHIKAVENMQATDDPEYSRWADCRLDRWLVDWSLRRGKEKSARRIAEEKGIENLVDIELFTDIQRIEDALQNQSCTEALSWCSENKAALRKTKARPLQSYCSSGFPIYLQSTLEFDLRLQEFIELARARRQTEAIAYSQKYFPNWQETHLPQIQQASALLAYPPTTRCSPYKRLYDPGRWQDLVHSLRLTIFNLNSLPSEPLLHLAIFAGLASLKLRTCYDDATKNVDCPVCDPWLGKLAVEVPFSHHVNSTIVCRMSGKIMNEDNPPMAFPNGYVYSREALEDMAAKNDGKVTCPHSGDQCDYSKLKKVFIS
ncbi:macrophage erythroblast attacher isoform 1 [Vararia minispora EC-137]|uniref:Macrophage erythroblast attacher isoform 1 n=1 Tax=Vararia minispora EC-137 TaxID=1314806 RepID=A0ACB8QUP4_9AGAM|nr:macrophage erythroblast attacher isoform 1 [Vararia minispora EC-137]